VACEESEETEMSDKIIKDIPCEVPIVEKLRSVPKDYRTCVAIQWSEDGRETGHRFIPVGYMMHESADEIERLRTQLAERDAALAAQKLLLSKYGRHSYSCEEIRGIADGRCSCGLDEALASLPADAKANAKIIKAAEEQERARDSWVDISSADLYLNACTATNQAVREKKELKP
jgi:hypothetical protein